METMTLDEAKKLMTEQSYEKLRVMVAKPMEIDISKKVGNDIIMAAFCCAVMSDIIQPRSLDEKLVKLLNSDTNTISDTKLQYIMDVVHKSQPNVKCIIKLYTPDMQLLHKWELSDDISLNPIFEYMLKQFQITPHMIREKMADTLKSTIVNNIGQLVSKYQSISKEEREEIHISITTIHRLVNMCKHILLCEFVDEDRPDATATAF